jgi:hypothetical protein
MKRFLATATLFCQALALFFSVCQPLANAAPAADFEGRTIVRTPEMDNLDRVDTVSWFAQESVVLRILPLRHGRPLAIPDGASACWIVADEEGTNWIARYATGISSNFAAFRLDAGEGALPDDREYTGFVTLLDGTNVLGVIDRFEVRVLWNPQDDTPPLTPPASGWPEVIAWVKEEVSGSISNAVEAAMSTLNPVIRTPDGRMWKAVGVYAANGVPTHAWTEFLGPETAAGTITLDMPDNRHFRMVGRCADNTNTVTHAWEEITP